MCVCVCVCVSANLVGFHFILTHGVKSFWWILDYFTVNTSGPSKEVKFCSSCDLTLAPLTYTVHIWDILIFNLR